MAGIPARPPGKRGSPRRGASPSMGSKGERQDGLAGVGVNRVPPGFARPRVMPAIHSLTGLPAGSLRTLLTTDVGEPVAASLGRSPVRTPAPVLCRPVSGFDAKRRLSGEAATERPINSPTPHRQAFPQAAWSHAQGVEPVADIYLPSRAWRSRPRTTLDRPHPQEHPVGFPPFRRERRECLPGEGLSSFDNRRRFRCGRLAATAGSTRVCVKGAGTGPHAAG